METREALDHQPRSGVRPKKWSMGLRPTLADEDVGGYAVGAGEGVRLAPFGAVSPRKNGALGASVRTVSCAV